MALDCQHPTTVVDTGAAERHSLSHPVTTTTTAISAASRVDENHQKQAFLQQCCLAVVEEAPQVAATVAVK